MSGGAGGGNATAAGACSAGGAAQFQLVAAFDAAPVPTERNRRRNRPRSGDARSILGKQHRNARRRILRIDLLGIDVYGNSSSEEGGAE